MKSEKSDGEFEKILKELIPKWMPLIFLEGFKKIEIKNNELANLRNIDVIFTSYDHFHGDYLKIWSSKFIDKGCKLVVASHLGGVLPKYQMHLDYEAEVCDHYLTTGQQNKKFSNSVQVGQFWNYLQFNKHNPKGKILLIPTINSKFTRDLASFPLGEQMHLYFKDQFKFYNNLNLETKKNLRLRLYKTNQGWNQKEYWMENCKGILFANNEHSYSRQVSKSSIIICTYLGRGFIELLSANIPAIIFWDTRLWEVNEFVKSDLNHLKKVGIFYDCPLNAANKLNSIFNEIDKWWFSDELQKQRILFCEKYGYLNSKMYKEIGSIVNNIAYKKR